MKIRDLRELAGLGQYEVARKAGVTRLRLSLAEGNHIELTVEEDSAVRRVLRRALEERARAIGSVLAESSPQTVSV